jgi:hypothetical protein
MDGLFELLPLLILLALVGLWLKLSRARELAVAEARRQCGRHGLQLLDETVGLCGLRLRRFHGQRRLERCYGFEVSIDGDDREPGRLWMAGDACTGLRLPTVETRQAEATPPSAAASAPASVQGGSNVVPLRPRDGQPRRH